MSMMSGNRILTDVTFGIAPRDHARVRICNVTTLTSTYPFTLGIPVASLEARPMSFTCICRRAGADAQSRPSSYTPYQRFAAGRWVYPHQGDIDRRGKWNGVNIYSAWA